MKAKFAKALAENITTIAGNVAHVALMDAGAIPNDDCHPPNRAQACATIEKCQSNIASILQQPGCWQSDEAPQRGHWTESEKVFGLLFLRLMAKQMPSGLLLQAGDDSEIALLAAQVNAEQLRGGWCECKPGTSGGAQEVYYNTDNSHGWMCQVCRRTTQTG